MLRKKLYCEGFREQEEGEAIFRIKKTENIKQVPLTRNEKT